MNIGEILIWQGTIPSKLMEVHDVSTVVDAVENDGRDCVKTASYDKSPQLPLL
jgi:hypothetical protein